MNLTDDELNNISNEDLIDIIENLIEENKLLKVENQVNERFLRKNDPELLLGITATLETAKRIPKIQFAQSVDEIRSETNQIISNIPSGHIKDGSDISRNESGTLSMFSRAASTASSIGTFRSGRQQATLSFVIKSEICDSECKLERNELNTFEQNMKIKFCELLTEIEEIKLTTQDVIHGLETFKDFVIEKGVNPITNKLPFERFEKFIRNYIRRGNIVVEKMRLKSFTLESNYTDKKLELQQRIEMSNILRPVDFEQLKIDIKTFSNSLEEKTANMMGLKNLNGNITFHLVDERRLLTAVEDRLRRYREKCKIYRKETEDMCSKIIKIENDIKYWSNLVNELNEKINSFTAPSFDNYFQLKIRLRESEKEENRLKRKKNIALIKLKNTKQKYEIKMNAKSTRNLARND